MAVKSLKIKSQNGATEFLSALRFGFCLWLEGGEVALTLEKRTNAAVEAGQKSFAGQFLISGHDANLRW